MRGILSAVSILAITAGASLAGGIDRSNQGIGILFETGRLVELSLGQVSPSVSGTDRPLGPFPGGNSSGNVADDFGQVGLSFKADLNEKLSYAIIFDQPFGADVNYGLSSPNLGGTRAYTKTGALTGILRYKFTQNFSVYGGVRGQRAFGDIALQGLAYRNPAAPTPGSGFDGYSIYLDDDVSYGYLVGVAYERPEIALRVALTYNSDITHEFDVTEAFAFGALTLPVRQIDVKTPQSVNLDFQTGIAKDTLVFGNVRWVDWEQFRINTPALDAATGGEGLIAIENTTTYTIGVGRRFNDTWSGSLSFTYEDDVDPLISPLGPTDGRFGVTLAAVYTKGNIRVTSGVNYTWLGDAIAETGTPDAARADFEDNDSYGFGVRVAYRF